MAVTLKQLGRENGERRLAVLGAMKELGEESDAFHAALAEPICASNVNFAILVGPEMAPLAEQLEGKVGFANVPDAEIGSASWRERVCTRVDMGGRRLNKKKKTHK